MVGPPQPVSTYGLYKCDIIVVCRELAVLCDDLYLTVIHIMIVSVSFSAAFAAASASSFPRIPT